MNDPALVTGGSGFVASHLIAHLLAEGEIVHTTVRSLANAAKVAPLEMLQQRYPGKLKLFEADLLKPGSFSAAMDGCRIVHHVASPFLMPEKITNGYEQMLQPALEGVRNVFASADATPNVERIVMTSTIGAIFGDYADVLTMQGGICSEAHFNTTSSLEHNPYHFSKVVAEQVAWKLAARQGRWSLVCINPGLVLGPTLTDSSDSGSLFLLDELMRGIFFYGAANLSFATVDVREVAAAHASAARNPDAKGRYVVADQEMISFVEMARVLRPIHRRAWLLPRWQIPNALVRLIGPAFGLSQKYMRNHLGVRFTCDNARSVFELGVNYRPIADTLRDHYLSWAS